MPRMSGERTTCRRGGRLASTAWAPSPSRTFPFSQKSRSPCRLRLFANLPERDQAALAFPCCKRRASLAVTIFPPKLQFPSFIRKTMPDQRRIEYHPTAASKELK